MFKLVIASVCLALVSSAPPAPAPAAPAASAPQAYVQRDPKNVAQIVKQESDLGNNGEFHYSFETSDGIKAAQAGELKSIGSEVGEAISGYYEYQYGNDVIKVNYTADENGFVASGPHIPAIPEPIARALKWAAEHPYKEPERKLKA